MGSWILVDRDGTCLELTLGDASDHNWVVQNLVLTRGAATLTFAIPENEQPKIPRLCLRPTESRDKFRLKTRAELEDDWAKLLDVLPKLQEIKLDTTKEAWFFGTTGLGAKTTTSGVLRLDLSAWLHEQGQDGSDVFVQIEASAAGSVSDGTTQYSASFRMIVDFKIEEQVLKSFFSFGIPLAGIRLPRISFSGLSFGELKWPDKLPLNWSMPHWLKTLFPKLELKYGTLAATLRVIDRKLQLTAELDTVEIVHRQDPGNPLIKVTTLKATVDPTAGAAASCVSIQVKSLDIPAGNVESLFGLDVGLQWAPVKVGSEIVSGQGLKLIINCSRVELRATDEPDAGLALSLHLVFVDGKLDKRTSKVHVIWADAPELTIHWQQLAGSLMELGVEALAASSKAIEALTRLLSRCFRMAKMPSAGPVTAAWSAVRKWLEKLPKDVSLQLVYDAAAHKLVRIVISGQYDGDQLSLEAAGLRIDAELPGGRIAVVIETAMACKGDWALVFVPPASAPVLRSPFPKRSSELVLTLSTDLWLKREDQVENAQDVKESDADIDSKPLLEVKWTYPDPPPLALIGMRAGKPAYLRSLPKDAFGAAGYKFIRLTTGSGSLGATAEQLDGKEKGKFEVTVDETRALPFLRKLMPPGGGSNPFQQYLSMSVAKDGTSVEKRRIYIKGNITLHLPGSDVAADFNASLDVDDWALQFEAETIDFKCKQQTREILKMDWTFVPEPANKVLFQLDLSGEPALRLHDQARVELSYPLGNEQALKFSVEKFAISRGGISLDATSVKQPVRLGGINTVFEFDSAQLGIRDSVVEGFQVAGRGSLPPALIGDAKVRASLRFAANSDGALELAEAYAELQNSGEPIVCPQIRFRFTIERIEMKFQPHASGPHFYFLLTGSAEFAPPAGEFADGLLKHLRNARIELNQCPLTDDVSVLGNHIKFTVPTPEFKPITLFELFRFEIRSIGFEPHSDAFEGAPAIRIGGQIDFAEIGGVVDPDISFHSLFIGPPKPSEVLPRIRCDGLRLRLQVASKVRVSGALTAVDGNLPTLFAPVSIPEGLTAHGFVGDGSLELPGLPSMAASFGFMEIRKGEERHRAWFVYLQRGKLTYQITAPIPLFIREVGFGLGYRYTLVGIAAAEAATTPAELIKALDDVAARQGDLARYEAWAPDFGEEGKFTFAMRAMVAMASSSAHGQHNWNPDVEEEIPSPLSMDLVAALRSDFTFLMTARVWLAANYNDFLTLGDALRQHPLVVGYLYLSPPRQEFLARLASAKDPYIGKHPVVPDLVKRALKDVSFSATLLMRPGLLHFELGWPDQLTWQDKFGPLKVSCRGGFVFRVEDEQLLLGMNFGAAGRLELSASAGSSRFGASIAAACDVAFAARIIAVIDARKVTGSMYYGLVAIDLNMKFSVRAWMSWRIFKKTISISIGFSFTLQINVALELVLTGDPDIAARARAKVGVRAFGRTLTVHVNMELNGKKVDRARARVAKYLDIGLTGPAQPPTTPIDEAPPELERAALPAAAVAAEEPGYVAWCLQTAWQDETKRSLALVLLVPADSHFYLPDSVCDPDKPDDCKPSPTYTLSGMPIGTQRFHPGGRMPGWTDEVNGFAFSSHYGASVTAESGEPITLRDYLQQTVLPAGSKASGIRRVRLDKMEPEQRGRSLRDAEEQALASAVRAAAQRRGQGPADRDAVPDPEEVEARDARDLLLAQFLEDMKSLAELPEKPKGAFLGSRLHALQIGLGFVLPETDVNGLAGAKVRESTATDPFTVRIHNLPESTWFNRRPPVFDALDIVNQPGQVAFAWDLVWPFTPASLDGAPDPEPEDFLLCYEVRRRVDGTDVAERLWQVMPCDTVIGAQAFRNAHQFVDDFSDPGMEEKTRVKLRDRTETHDLSYTITPICQAGTRGEPILLRVRREAIAKIPVPSRAEATWQLEDSEAGPAVIELGVSGEIDWGPPEQVSKRYKVEVVLRPELIAAGGQYGVDAELVPRNDLGSNSLRVDDWRGERQTLTNPSTGPFKISFDSGSQFGLESGPKVSLGRLLDDGAGRLAWRVFVRCVEVEGDHAGPLMEATQVLVPRPKPKPDQEQCAPPFPSPFLSVREFELPMRVEKLHVAKLAVRGSAGGVRRLRPKQGAANRSGTGPAPADGGTLYRLQWPLRAHADMPPVARFVIEMRDYDALPPSLHEVGRDALPPPPNESLNVNALSRELARVDVMSHQRAVLLPQHNRDGAQWEALYPASGKPQSDEEYAAQWPPPSPMIPFANAPRPLLDYIEHAFEGRGKAIWPSALSFELVRDDSEEVQDLQLCYPGQPAGKSTNILLEDPSLSNVRRLLADLEVRAVMEKVSPWTLHRDVRLKVTPKIGEEAAQDPYIVSLAELPRLHGLLQRVAAAIESTNEAAALRVEFQAPGQQPSGSFEEWLQATPAGPDPYGWQALHDLGLAMTLRIYDRRSDAYLSGAALRDVVISALRALVQGGAMDGTRAEDFLFVDVLLQPQQLDQSDSDPRWTDAGVVWEQTDDLALAMVQVSLRPRPRAIAFEAGWDSFVRVVEPLGWRWDGGPSKEVQDQLRQHAMRFLRFGGDLFDEEIPFALAAPRLSDMGRVVADREDVVDFRWRDKDTYGHQRQFRVTPVGRYDQVLAQLFGGSPDGTPSQWSAPVLAQRHEPVSPPAVLSSQWLSLKVDKDSVPIWQVALGRHAEQAGSEANAVLKARLQFGGVLHSLTRSAADPEWVLRVIRELRSAPRVAPAEPGPIKLPLLASETIEGDTLEEAWSNSPDDADKDAYGAMGRALWPGADVLRFPALPHCYRYDLALAARAGQVVSTVNMLTAPRQDIAMEEMGPPDEEIFEASSVPGAGAWMIRLDPSRYERFIDRHSKRVWEPAGNGAHLRDLPDPDVSYQIDVELDGNVRQPVAYVARSHDAGGPSYRALPLGRQFDVRATLRPAEPDGKRALPLSLEIALRPWLEVKVKLKDPSDQEKEVVVPLEIIGGLEEEAWKKILGPYEDGSDPSLAELAEALDREVAILTAPWQLEFERAPLGQVNVAPPSDELSDWLVPVTAWKVSVDSAPDPVTWKTTRDDWRRRFPWRSGTLRRAIAGVQKITPSFLVDGPAFDAGTLPKWLKLEADETTRYAVLGFIDDAKLAVIERLFGKGVAQSVRTESIRRMFSLNGSLRFVVRRCRPVLPIGRGVKS